MQSIVRSLAPVHFDGHIQHDAARPSTSKIFTPGELVAGVVRIKKEDVVNVKTAWVEVVGEQMTQYGDKLFNAELRPVQYMEKTFFRERQDLPAQPDSVLGEYAYYDFSIRIPEYDQYVPAGSESATAERKPLPPSLVVQPQFPKTSLQPIAYNRYYVRICVESQGQLGRTFSHTLPFLLLPLDPTPQPVPPSPWTESPSEHPSHAPADWTRYRPNEVWRIGVGDKASGGFFKGLLRRKESAGSVHGKTEVRVALSLPSLPSWPRNQPIPFHLLITATAPSPTALDLSAIAINFQLFQKIRVVAKGMYEDHDAVRHSAEEDGVRRGREGKHAREEFAVDVVGDWTEPFGKSKGSEGFEGRRVVVGSFKVGMLPSFVNGGLSIKYGLKLELLMLSTFTSQVFSLVQPVISSGLRGGLPAYDEGETLVPPAYWDVEDKETSG